MEIIIKYGHMKHLRVLFLTLGCLFLQSVFLGAQLRVPTCIGNRMVLQRDTVVNLWGWGTPGEEVCVTASWLGDSVTSEISGTGEWMISIPTAEAAYRQKVTIRSAGETLHLSDVMLGDVWICAGQSNMQFPVEQTTDVSQALRTPNPDIRLYNTGSINSPLPQEDIYNVRWTDCSPGVLKSFSAVGYAFGDKLQRETGVPIGLIETAFGGTPIEAWTPQEYIDSNPLFRQGITALVNKQKSEWTKRRLSTAAEWNANINPLKKMVVSGVIWYQGCQNVSYSANYYDLQLETMIGAWREQFNSPELPFYVVQLVPMMYYNDILGALLREKQAMVASKLDNVEIVASIDQVDNIADIHPRNKRIIGERLANAVLGTLYGKENEWRMPVYSRHKTEGTSLRVWFDNAESGLVCDGDIIGFQVADASNVFVRAKAEIDSSDNTVVLTAPNIDNPQHVRYCFNETCGNLMCRNSLPVMPFRTDFMNDAQYERELEGPVVSTPVTIEGKGFEKDILSAGMNLWPNNDYILQGSINEFLGYDILKMQYGQSAITSGKFTIIPKTDGYVYMLTGERLKFSEKNGWRMMNGSGIDFYNPKTKRSIGKVFIAYRGVKKGERVTVNLEGCFAGGVAPLASEINYKEK